jgi:hypothetical protein
MDKFRPEFFAAYETSHSRRQCTVSRLGHLPLKLGVEGVKCQNFGRAMMVGHRVIHNFRVFRNVILGFSLKYYFILYLYYFILYYIILYYRFVTMVY